MLRKTELNKIREGAIQAARAGGKILLKYHLKRRFDIREKEGAGLVTNADLESERAIVKLLRKTRPDFDFLTEEATTQTMDSEPRVDKTPALGRWIIDPLDGTTNFVHGFPMFCVSIAAEWKGEIVAGAIYHPVMDEMYWATLGQGAFINGKRMKVSGTKKLTESLLTTGFTYRKDDFLRKEMEAFERLSRIARAIRRPGSAALDLAYTARGVFDGFWERRLSPWDVAAGAILVKEAGGKVTDFSGNPFRAEAAEILASNSVLHKTLKQAVAPDSCPI